MLVCSLLLGPASPSILLSYQQEHATVNDNCDEALADGNKVRYININDKLADNAGNLYAGMTMDKVHLSLKGCQVWADTLKPILTELLGPPAKEDHSPPPTGDPSAVTKPQVESKG